MTFKSALSRFSPHATLADANNEHFLVMDISSDATGDYAADAESIYALDADGHLVQPPIYRVVAPPTATVKSWKQLQALSTRLGLDGDVQRVNGGYQFYDLATGKARWLDYRISDAAEALQNYADRREAK